VETGTTGNPVFDFRAGFRTRADLFQRFLLGAGLGLLIVGGGVIPFFFPAESRLSIALAGVLGGVALLFAGIAWGFYWRRRLRDEFRKQYGPPQ
jgi:hypothetical protein